MSMKISLITDEISADPETAIELGTQWGVHDFELRGFYADRAPQLSPFQKQSLRDVLDEYQARIVAIGPGLFKIPYPPVRVPHQYLSWMDRANYEQWSEMQRLLDYHLNELLSASLDYACELGATVLVIFGFDRAGAPPGLPPDEVLYYLQRAAERAQGAGIRLALENEAGFWADTGQRSAQVVKMVHHPALGLNWDPGNAFFAGDEPYPAGYQFVRGMVQHVHFKDARRDANGLLQYSNKGQVDWAGQIRALAADGYTGHISVETHLHPKVSSALTSLERLQALIAEAHSSPSNSWDE
jgi:sugar phosphate isomerase/epimerase